MAEFRTEFDVTSCLREMGHDVRAIGIGDSLTELRTTIQDWQPHVCFNLLEEFDGIVTYDQHVVAYLELLRQPYTGCNPRGMMLSRDKVLSKQILAYHRIATPQFAVFRRGGALRIRSRCATRCSSSPPPRTPRSASRRPRSSRTRAAPARAHRVHPRAHQVRRAGRGVRRGPRALRRRARQRAHPHAAAVGVHLRRAEPGRAAIATRKVKWDRAYQKRHGITSGKAEDLPAGPRRAARPARAAHLPRAALTRLRAHRLPRARADGSLFVLEANANPNLERERGLRRLGAARRHRLPGAARPDPHRSAAPTVRSGGRTSAAALRKGGRPPSFLRVGIEPAEHFLVPLQAVRRLQDPVVLVREEEEPALDAATLQRREGREALAYGTR